MQFPQSIVDVVWLSVGMSSYHVRVELTNVNQTVRMRLFLNFLLSVEDGKLFFEVFANPIE